VTIPRHQAQKMKVAVRRFHVSHVFSMPYLESGAVM